ncbi:uncharacterized protein LOC130928956 isoform X3 [Corythoichthys intestinalis]|uniref:uncharacterized protein LOC130928956 isoform X3 n=1 Tax=Corythoichthys intestinalis TaxID=161448 RepID=UPI0025A57ADB|nr:uncharacterized protein LOC130928956 isoform X3 [Corythoichthys intestinalis]
MAEVAVRLLWKGFRKYLGPEQQESESPGIKEEIEHPQIKKEQLDDHHQQKREEQLPIKKEEVELTLEVEPYIKEEEDVTRPTDEPLKSEGGLSETRRGAESASGSSNLTERLQADSFTAPLSDSEDAMSHLPDRDDEGIRGARLEKKLFPAQFVAEESPQRDT